MYVWLYTLLTLIPFIGSQLQCSQSIALTYHLINYLGPETWLREWYYNFWWRKNGVSFCGPLEKYVYQDKSTHSFVNKNDLDSFSEEHVCLRIVIVAIKTLLLLQIWLILVSTIFLKKHLWLIEDVNRIRNERPFLKYFRLQLLFRITEKSTSFNIIITEKITNKSYKDIKHLLIGLKCLFTIMWTKLILAQHHSLTRKSSSCRFYIICDRSMACIFSHANPINYHSDF